MINFIIATFTVPSNDQTLSDWSHYGATETLLGDQRNVPFPAKEMSDLEVPEGGPETPDVQPPGVAGPHHGPPGAQLGLPGPPGRGLRRGPAGADGGAEHGVSG